MKLMNGDGLNYNWYCEKDVFDEERYNTLGECLAAIVRYIDAHLPDYVGIKDMMDDLGDITVEEDWFLGKDSPEFNQKAYDNCDESQTTNEAVWWGSVFDLLDEFGLITVNELYSDLDDEAESVGDRLLKAYRRE